MIAAKTERYRAGCRGTGRMAVEKGEAYYEALVEQELALAASAADREAKIKHLNNAARYATLCERSRVPHRSLVEPPE